MRLFRKTPPLAVALLLALGACTQAPAPMPTAAGSTSTPAPAGTAATATSTVPVAATPTAAPATPRPSPSVTPTATPTSPKAEVGYLEGKASIGPLVPVEREGVPTPTPSPAVCTSRGLTVLQADGQTEVTSFNLAPDCTFRVALAPGTYVVQLKQTQGIGGSKDLPKTVEIRSGETARLDISIDTGIR